MKHRKPEGAPREDYTLVEFDTVNAAPMRDLIVAGTPAGTVLRGRLLDRFAQSWDRHALAVDMVADHGTSAILEIRCNGHLLATAKATALEVQLPASRTCPRCSTASVYTIADVRLDPRRGAVLTGCRRCGWRSGVADYDLGRTA